ncbi:hypothetical protein J2T60_001711 [Natronospira proteinivora]|uniref:Uncharacterized protein n=1 Tax=Natronospira proteinivora TaxID=1807133 RepID=A0ABT1G905_9GAMM|nr:hypothetical protein [Natronospira proteinivora]
MSDKQPSNKQLFIRLGILIGILAILLTTSLVIPRLE